MHPDLYKAAKNGDTETIHKFIHRLAVEVTPTKNTVLHVIVQFSLRRSSSIITTIFHGQSSESVNSMLLKRNSQGETALHIAAKNRRYDVVVELIRHAKKLDEDAEKRTSVAMEMLGMKNKCGDTALHEAVRCNDENIVKILIGEDPNIEYLANDMKETPLYLAVESHFHGVVKLILEAGVSPSYQGPKCRTALHAAIINKCKECTELMITAQALAKKKDAFGWTPLHYAVLFDFEFGASQLLKVNSSLAYSASNKKDDKKTALHVAVCNESVNVMKEILKYREDCWEMITSRGQNILHLAVHHKMKKALGFILSNSRASNLINQKDFEGNTPLHLYATSEWPNGCALLRLHGANLNTFNKQNCTPLDVFLNTYDFTKQVRFEADLRSKGAKSGARNVITEKNGVYRTQRNHEADSKRDVPVDLRKLSDTHLIVAVLIATVTFAAGFTVPGGYKETGGEAILTKRTAFKTFIIADTMAMMSSIVAITLNLAASLREDSRFLRLRYGSALLLIKFALTTMVIAFTTGVYITLLGPSPLLAITVCVAASFALFVLSQSLVLRVLALLRLQPIDNIFQIGSLIDVIMRRMAIKIRETRIL